MARAAASQALGNGLFGALERVGGGIVGAAQAILILWLAGGVIAAGPFPNLSPARPALGRASGRRRVPAAADRDRHRARPAPRRQRPAERLHRSGAAAGARHRPARPTSSRARSAQRAAPSVLRVVARWLRSAGERHVVRHRAGVPRHERARRRRGRWRPGPDVERVVPRRSPVLLDLELDVALLLADGLRGPCPAVRDGRAQARRPRGDGRLSGRWRRRPSSRRRSRRRTSRPAWT